MYHPFLQSEDRDFIRTDTRFRYASRALFLRGQILLQPFPAQPASRTMPAAVARNAVIAGKRFVAHDIQHPQFIGQRPRLLLVNPHQRRMDNELLVHRKIERDVERLDE